MLTLKTLLRATRQMAKYGELGVAVPRDHCPPDYYPTRAASWYCDQCHVEVRERRCPHCGTPTRSRPSALQHAIKARDNVREFHPIIERERKPMSILKPVCVPCRRFFRCERNGYWFTEGMPSGRWGGPGPTPSGKDYDEFWRPYKIWVGDKWRCEGCGTEIVTGVLGGPVSEHYKTGFDVLNERSQMQVNDC